ncbi:hypothetical protein, partial [Brevibacterium sp. HMSC07C04]|uniref:hypothetical protein n=1 Tax=Brevibacterium sp. HMSC07C04 TaxID=1581130 RepID=UPI001C401B72
GPPISGGPASVVGGVGPTVSRQLLRDIVRQIASFNEVGRVDQSAGSDSADASFFWIINTLDASFNLGEFVGYCSAPLCL